MPRSCARLAGALLPTVQGRDPSPVLSCMAGPKGDGNAEVTRRQAAGGGRCSLPRTGSIRQSSLALVRVGCEEAVTHCTAGTGRGMFPVVSVCRWPVLISFDKYLSCCKLHHKWDPEAFGFCHF